MSAQTITDELHKVRALLERLLDAEPIMVEYVPDVFCGHCNKEIAVRDDHKDKQYHATHCPWFEAREYLDGIAVT